MLWAHFGEMREVPTRNGGTKSVGERAIHVQCPWRVCNLGRIVIAYHDFYYSPEGKPLKDDWDTLGKSRFDSVADLLCTEFEKTPPVVTSIDLDDVGGFSLHFSHNYRLDVFPDDSSDSGEHWRIFEPGAGSKNFIL
jgi:hypothetical protein